MKKSIILLTLVLLLFFYLGCNREEEEELPYDKDEIEAVTTESFNTQEEADNSQAGLLYASMPEGAPISVEAEKILPPVPVGPVERIPFLGLVMALGRVGFRVPPDSIWGVWSYVEDTGWVQRECTPGDTSITLTWPGPDGTAILSVENITLYNDTTIEGATFYLIHEDNMGQVDTLASLTFRFSWFTVDGKPVNLSADYQIFNLINVSLFASADTSYATLRSRQFVGFISATVVNPLGDTINVYVEKHEDTSEFLSVSIFKFNVLWAKDINISAIIDTIPGYLYRDITGQLIQYTTEYKTASEYTILGRFEGRIWYPEDENHQSYLYFIFPDGSRINLWEN